MKQLIETKSMLHEDASDIKIVGIGNSGKEIIDYLIETGERKSDYFIVDTKEIENSNSLVENIVLEEKENSEEKILKIKKLLENTDMLITILKSEEESSVQLALLIAKIAKEMKVFTVGIINELEEEKDIKNLIDKFDIIVPINKNLLSYEKTKEAIMMTIKSIIDNIQIQGVIYLNFSDIKSIISGSKIINAGYGEANGKDRAKIATKEALNHLLLEATINDTKNVIMTIKASSQLGLTEAYAIFNLVKEKATKAEVIFGVVANDELGDTLQVMLLATEPKFVIN